MNEVLRLKKEGRYSEALERLSRYVIDEYDGDDNVKLSIVSAIEGISNADLSREMVDEFIDKLKGNKK